jgi:hypothetical protein
MLYDNKRSRGTMQFSMRLSRRAEMAGLQIQMTRQTKYMVSFHLYNTANIENMGLNGALYDHIEIYIQSFVWERLRFYASSAHIGRSAGTAF